MLYVIIVLVNCLLFLENLPELNFLFSFSKLTSLSKNFHYQLKKYVAWWTYSAECQQFEQIIFFVLKVSVWPEMCES